MIYAERISGEGWGWHRGTVHQRPTLDRGRWPSGERYVVGGPVGIVGHTIDVWCNPRQGQRIALDLAQALPDTEPLPALPQAAMLDPVGYYGRPRVAGVPFEWVGFEPGGSGLMTQWRASLQDGAITADLWLHVTQDDVDEVDGVMTVTAGNIQRSELSHEIARDIIDFVLEAGERMGDAQAFTCRVRWDRRTQLMHHGRRDVIIRGIDTVGHLGVPERGRFDPVRWHSSKGGEQISNVGNWNLTGLGITPDPGVTGDQEDQGFAQGFESFYPGASLATIETRWLAAARYSMRCMHYLHPNGDVVDPERINAQGDRAVYWGGRPWPLVGSRYNKPRDLRPLTDSNGWGADEDQHRFINTLATAYELTGCPALHNELVHWAMLYLGSETTNPAWSSSTLFVSRAVGWNCLVAVHLWRLLKDRNLAERVKVRCLQRIELHQQRWGWGFWDIRPADRRWITSEDCTQGVMLWQQAVGAFGVYIAAEVFGRPDLKEWAADAAALVADYGYSLDGREWEYVGLDRNGGAPSPVNYVDGVNASRNSGYYRHAWMPLALWVAQDFTGPSGYQDNYLALMREAAANGAWERPLDWFPPVRTR